jgi:hypothetical protein
MKKISACVLKNWTSRSNPRCKFYPGDRASCYLLPDGSKVQYKYKGRVGTVIAVTCTPDGLIRGQAPNGITNRQYTRYYLQFPDKEIVAYESCYLAPISKKQK